MGTIITLIILVAAIMLVFFKNDILSKNTSLDRIRQTSGFVVCVVALIALYIININLVEIKIKNKGE